MISQNSTKSQLEEIFSTLLSDKLGGSKYKNYLPLQNLKSSISDYIKDEIKKRGIGPGTAEYNIVMSMLRNLTKKSTPEEVLLLLSETMFKISGQSVN